MKNPPPAALSIADGDLIVLPADTLLTRISFTQDPHATEFGRLRTWGPVEHGRWDPHRGLTGSDGTIAAARDPERGVLYAALDVDTALAEVFQDEDDHLTAETPRIIDLQAGGPTLIRWRTTRPLELLDLTGSWALRHGASASLGGEPRQTCQEWARAIANAVSSSCPIDGLWVRSTMTGRPMPVLYGGSVSSFPQYPVLSRLLADGAILDRIVAAAQRIGYDVTTSPA